MLDEGECEVECDPEIELQPEFASSSARYSSGVLPEKHVFIKKGLLLKRGSHEEDRYVQRYEIFSTTLLFLISLYISSESNAHFILPYRYICLFSTKIGYSLSTTPNVICNFLSMNDISGAALEDPDSTIHHAECSFVVQVHMLSRDRDVQAMSRNESLINTPKDAKLAGNCKLDAHEHTACDKDRQESSLEPQPYHLQASSVAERDQWMSAINTTLRAYQRNKAEKARQQGSALRMYQLRLRSFYTGLPFQTSTALLVAVNFFVTVLIAYIISPAVEARQRNRCA